MAEAAIAKGRVTVAAFLAFAGEPATRYGLVDGEIPPMAVPTDAHGTIPIDAAVAIGAVLAGKAPCRVVGQAGIPFDEVNGTRSTSCRPTSR